MPLKQDGSNETIGMIFVGKDKTKVDIKLLNYIIKEAL